MRTAGIIAEYNPFHNGHAWQIAELKKRGFEAVVCVCSPGVVQRGTAALFPARVRTRLRWPPGRTCAQPAGTLRYAVRRGLCSGGVALLSALGVWMLCVSAQRHGGWRISPKPQRCWKARTFQQRCAALDAGLRSPPRGGGGSAVSGSRRVLRAPNDILGVEYCKALLRQHSALVPLALPRRGAAHDAPLDAAPGRYASASALRALVRAGGAAALAPHVPPACLRLYMQAEAEGDILDGRAFGIAVLSRLRAMDAAGLRAVRGAAEGLENRLAAAVQGAGTLDELVQAMRTKRYATARLRRLVLDAALGYTGDLPALPPYLHVLGANETGLAVLRCARQAALLPLSHSLADLAARSAPAARVAAAHAAAEDLTALCLRHPAPMGAAYTAKPVFPTSGAK
ncbi:MAG: nucleotidyltransferase family protein [Ruthenibacterium lactatiformans]